MAGFSRRRGVAGRHVAGWHDRGDLLAPSLCIVNTEVVEADRWGVPAGMFGPVNEDFYGLVGRVALVATLLEDRLHVLFCSLARVPQDRMAGEPGTVLIKQCIQYLDRFSTCRHDEAAALFSDAEAALLKRHEVVHSLWPFSAQDPVQGWRSVPKTRRQQHDRSVEWTSLRADELPDLVSTLVDLVDRCRQLELWVILPTP